MDEKTPFNMNAFDINEFLRRHLVAKNWLNYQNQRYAKEELIRVAELATEQFRAENTLARISPPCTVVGDIHGQYADLVRLLSLRITKDQVVKSGSAGFAANRWVFLGDYVDRGSNSVECIALMFALKIIYPAQYVLLRGNHETRAINFAYGFREELLNKLDGNDGVEVWEKFNDAFSYMPLACLIGERILCMHGGISPALTSLDDIRKIKRPLVDVAKVPLAQDLLWADPFEQTQLPCVKQEAVFQKNAMRGLSVSFNESAVKETCKRLDLCMIVRAHQMVNDGFKFFADKKLMTIFSAPRYMNETDNRGAVLKIDKTGACSIAIMRNLKPLARKDQVKDELTTREELRSITYHAKSNLSTSSSSSHSKK